jgi:hypothetical protein
MLNPRTVKLHAAFVAWNAIDQQPQLAIQPLQFMQAGANLRLLSCQRRGWNLDLFDLVSACLPDIYVFNLANLLVVDSRPTKVCLTRPSFPSISIHDTFLTGVS